MKRFVDRSVIVNRMDSKDARIARETLQKPRPKLLDKRAQRVETAKTDRRENALVRLRSHGKCEVFVWYKVGCYERCLKPAVHVHHLVAGIGRRNVGRSISAACKLHVCVSCHQEIHGHVLVPMNHRDRDYAETVCYERVT